MDSVFILIKLGVFLQNLRPYLFLAVGSRSDDRCFSAYVAHLTGLDRDAVSVLKDAGTVHANFQVPATATGRVSRDVSTAVRSRLDGQIIIFKGLASFPIFY